MHATGGEAAPGRVKETAAGVPLESRPGQRTRWTKSPSHGPRHNNGHDPARGLCKTAILASPTGQLPQRLR